ncbi:methenyltetrahydrofolate synthase domain-containing protein isoform X1 [Neophocaena asiaeorientalis asiaeorientalis]|uniref:Methenyltetrahydrofolate synthase domain-containing protein n=3 Tax=Neophocaena asiaeorientalis asiaeorientalis TaxID=1706337 RepID=A0A341AL57_NEOAA|nr:methenyltetrahydrofolate synthase domain-containing protein isoform X1 [Neophocaena asiaeorientalis asiaeorientalis]
MEPRAGVSKQDIREQIWDYMEARNLADFPRPVHHRIPNFKGASRAAEHFPRLQAFKMARTIKVNPDAPQKNARFLVLNSKKTLLVPTPRLRTGLFNKITPPPGATKDVLRKCATSQGVKNYSTPVGLDSRVLVDLVVVGSVAVSEKGWRIGKGEGYADLEYSMMVSMGAVSQGTPVVTIVHDCQVVDIPETLLEDHDLTVDYILTPTRVITTGCERPKPTGIVWSKISCEMMGKMPVLRSLHCREEQAGKDVTLRDKRQSPPGARAALSTVRSPRELPSLESGSLQGDDVPSSTVYVGNLPRDARVSELKRALSARGAAPSRLTWQGPQRGAFLHYRDPAEAWQAISRLQGFCLGANTARVALARRQGASGPAGGRAGEPHPDP